MVTLPTSRAVSPIASTFTLSPRTSVMVLSTSKRSLTSSGSLPTITSSGEARTAPVMSFGWILACGTVTLPVTSILRPLTSKSRSGEASICASGRSATRRLLPSR